jgi:hypothetical protein
MKMLLIVADAARLDSVRRTLEEDGAPGYTELPVIEGSGRTGVHAGDRVHPGALVALFTIVEDEASSLLFDSFVARRDAEGDRITRCFLLPVERQG